MKKNDDIELEMQETVVEEPAVQEEVSMKEEAAEMKEQAKKTIQLIKEKAKEEDPKPNSSMTLRTILGGDFLTADMVRRQIWLFVLMVVFCIVYVAIRYQCQQDMLTIDLMRNTRPSPAPVPSQRNVVRVMCSTRLNRTRTVCFMLQTNHLI